MVNQDFYDIYQKYNRILITIFLEIFEIKEKKNVLFVQILQNSLFSELCVQIL